MSAKAKAMAVGMGLLIVFSLMGGLLSYKQIEEGHVGVTKDWGAVNGETLAPGAHWKIPIQQGVQNVEIRPRTYTMSQTKGEGEKARSDAITVKTVNGSSVDVDITVRYRINAEEADQFVSDWNNEQQMETRLIRPTIRTVLRDEASRLETTGQDAIYTQAGRAALEESARDALEGDFEDEPITLEAVQIRNIDLPDSIDQALDEKETAKQRVQVERERVAQEEAKAQQQIVKAEADAKEDIIAARAGANATRIRGEALEDYPIVLSQQYIEALENGETVYVGADNGIALTREIERGSSTNTSGD